MSITSVPKSVSKIWDLIIKNNFDFMSAQEISEELEIQTNSVLQTVRRNSQYFDIRGKKPVFVSVKPTTEIIAKRDKFLCTFCGTQLSKNTVLIDTIDYPADPRQKTIANTITICNSCKSRRNSISNKDLNAEEYSLEFHKNNYKKISANLGKIRKLGGNKPLYDPVMNTNQDTLFGAIYRMEKDIHDLRNEMAHTKSRNQYEYLEVIIAKMEDILEGHYHWAWNYDPVRELPSEDYYYWYFSRRNKVTFQGGSKENGLEDILDYFGQQGYDISGMNWIDEHKSYEEEDCDEIIQVIFKKEI